MGLFGKKEKKRCPICDGEMTFFKSQCLADGEICETCEKLIRGQFLAETYYTESGMAKQDDPIKQLTVEEARAVISRKQKEAADAVAELSGDFSDLFKAEDAFSISPKALDVGLKRSKLLKDKGVLRGVVMAGSFNQGDSVQLKRGDSLTPTTILELIPITSTSEFDTELGANMHKKTAEANTGAWFILDISGSDVRVGDTVVK